MTEIETQEMYSRRRRRTQEKKKDSYNSQFKERLLPTKWWPALLWSTLFGAFSVANPYLTQFATNLQTQSLYAGMAMREGQIPYSDFFGTNGVLYYLMTYLGAIFQPAILLGFFQFVALLIAGLYFYKIISYFSQSEKTATNFSHWFYIFVFAINFGGIYAGIFALPFTLTSIWFLVRYFENAVRDEAFILYGIDAALVFLIYPKSLILWLIASLVLFIYNATHRQMARGFYQFLATLFGFLLIVYAIGYYAFETQILGLAIQQTFLYNISLGFTYDGIVLTSVLVAVFLLFSGFLKNIFQTLFSLGQKQHTYIKVVILLTFLLQTVFIVGSVDFQWTQLLLLLPYGFVMSAIHLQIEELEDFDNEGVEVSYLKHQFFLPLLVAILIPVQSLYHYFIDADVYKERVELASYIKDNSDEESLIYTWDSSAYVYLESQRLSSASLVTAEPYLHTEDNQNSLTYDLNKNEAQFILVNKGIPLLEGIKTNLEEHYKLVETGTSYLALYEKK